MKKFKEFKVNTNGHIGLGELLISHAVKSFGVSFDKDDLRTNHLRFQDYPWVIINDHLGLSTCNDQYIYSEDAKELTIFEFLDLKKEDVVVKPKRFECFFTDRFEKDREGITASLTQDQKDRIKAIMEES